MLVFSSLGGLNMRGFSALFLLASMMTAPAAAGQQSTAATAVGQPISGNLVEKLVKEKLQGPLGQLKGQCPTCQTLGVPIPPGPTKVQQYQGTPVGGSDGKPACPKGLDAATTATMRAKLGELVTPTVAKALEDSTAGNQCPGISFALVFAQIVLADDVSITKAKK